MILEHFDDNNLIICPNNYKKKIVEEINNSNKLYLYKVMDINEFNNNYFFSYNNKTILYLMEKYNIKYEVALEYLDSLYYIEDKEYKYDKLNKLVSIKNDLLNNKLLDINNNFLYYLNHVKVIVIGYDLDPFYINIFNKYNHIIISNNYTKKDISVLEFDYIDDEVSYVLSDIRNKLNTYDINNIKLICNGSEYTNILKRIFGYANIPIDIVNKISLYNLPISKVVINSLKDNKSFSDILDSIKDYDSNLYNEIVNIFNNYIDFDCETSRLLPLIVYDLKNTTICSEHLSNSITITDFNNINSNDYIYLLGFNKENYPKLYKDEDFLSDKMKIELGLFTSDKKNNLELERLRNNIYNINNLTISYKLKTSFSAFNPCILIDEDSFNIVTNPKYEYNFSNKFNRIKLASLYDNYYKYGIIDDDLKLLRSNYKDLEYDTYNNVSTGLDLNNYLSTLDKLNLSYSNIDNYFRCSFRYYLNSVLKITEDNFDDFYINIGKIFHYVLSKYRDIDFDFDKSWNEEASKYEFTFDKLVFLEKLKQELKFDLDVIRRQENYTKLNSYLFEKRLYVDIPNSKNINVKFNGVIDKIIYDEVDNNNIVSVVDYKTGTLPSNLNNIIYGIGMQLPIYVFLIRRSDLFSNIKIAGFYLQKIINKDMKRTLNKDITTLKEEALKLVGYSNLDQDILSYFDMTYSDSNLISSLKKKNDGDYYSYSKVLNDSELDNLDKLVSDNINNGTEDILNAKFDINPKKVDKENIGCSFCCYRDICFKKEKDIIELKKYNNLEFLRGDIDA